MCHTINPAHVVESKCRGNRLTHCRHEFCEGGFGPEEYMGTIETLSPHLIDGIWHPWGEPCGRCRTKPVQR